MSDLSVTLHLDAALARGKPVQSCPTDLALLFERICHEELLYPVFQPVVDVRNRAIFGYEALIRGPQDSVLSSPYELFRCASALAKGDEFELLCRKLSIRQFARAALPHRLFINTSPGVLLSGKAEQDRTLRYLREAKLEPGRVVIEVTEHQRTREYEQLSQTLQQYRSVGFQVALDDVGAGYSGLRLWKEVLPDYIKVDKHFIRDIHLNKLKQSFLKGLLEIAVGSNCRVVTEGVEKREEFEYLYKLGIVFMQGYYFALPSATPPTELDPILFRLTQSDPQPMVIPLDSLHRIAKPEIAIPFATKVKDVLEMLQKDPELDLIPVINASRPVGLVERYSFLNKIMKSVYGVSLYSKLSIVDFLEQEPVIVDVNTSLDNVSQKVTSHGWRMQGFIVTEQEKYFGVGHVHDLLQVITRAQINSARHANPLTLLPGIVPTNELIDRLLTLAKPFTIAYFDLDNFKPYNDHYGYEAGDKVIRKLADILRELYPLEVASICHIGGDDFVVVDLNERFLERCDQVFTVFAREVPAFYSAEHIEAGGIRGIDRHNQPRFFNLLSLSVGIVPPELTLGCHSHLQIADLASEAKKQAKKRDGNSRFINNRRSSL